MTEFVWPAVVLALGVLAFIRTRPRGPDAFVKKLDEAVHARIDTCRDRLDDLENQVKAQKEETSPSEVVRRVNLISGDMNTVKARMLKLEEGWRATETAVTSIKNAQGLKKIVGASKE